MKKRNLVTLLGIPLLASMLAFSSCDNCDPKKAQKKELQFEYSWINKKSRNILDDYKNVKEIKIEKGDRYLDYAKELQKNPKLKDIRADTIAGYLRMINDGKDLINKQYTKFPTY